MRRALGLAIATVLAFAGCYPAGATDRGRALRHTAVSPGRSADRQVCTGSQYELFCDDFNGTTLDASKWSPNWFGGAGPVNGNESACYDPTHVSVHDGVLDLKLTETSSSCKGANRPETTGVVSTLNKFTTPATDYRVTVRAFIPGDTNGTVWNWPAVWTDGTGTWPHTGESDIAEGLSGKVCWHYHSDAGGPGGCPSGSFVGWHTFREDVVGGTVTYRYDGNVVGSTAATQAPHFLVESEQGSGSYGGPRKAASMLIRSVRVVALRQKG